MEELTERQKVLKQLQRTIEEWNAAQSVVSEVCAGCNNPMDQGDTCEECGRDWAEDRAEYGDDGAQALSVSQRVVSRIEITIGGPTAFIDYDHRTGRATFFSSYYGDGDEVALSDEEAQDVAQLFALDTVGAGLDSDTRAELGL